jgi:hypothetical protein
MASPVRTALLAAAPWSVRYTHRGATSRGVARFRLRRLRRDRFSGRRGCGITDLFAPMLWSGTHHNSARRMQRPSAWAFDIALRSGSSFLFSRNTKYNKLDCYLF